LGGSTFLGQQEHLAIFNAERDQTVRTPVNLLTSEDLLVKAQRTLQIVDPKLCFQDTVDFWHGQKPDLSKGHPSPFPVAAEKELFLDDMAGGRKGQ
jgi:hypothetical protein